MMLNEKNDLTNRLGEVIDLKNIYPDEPLSKHTSFKIGGPAAFFAVCENVTELRDVINVCKEAKVKWFLLGNGTNVLAPDEGYDGLVIKLGGKFNELSIMEDINDGTGLITAGAGVSLAQLCVYALKKGFTGLEFAGGIPGTVGGGVFMNAGAYGGEMADSIVSVKALTEAGEVVEYKKDELDFGYRHSRFTDDKGIVLEASFRLKVYPRIPIRTMMEEYKRKRNEKQPLDLPSAGSVFKRPAGSFAGKLIEDAGLKGYTIGGAAVSDKHAGFIVNVGNATAKDVEQLIEYVQKRVFDESNVRLEPEIRIIK